MEEKMYYKLKRARIAHLMSDALIDIAILDLQEQGLPVTDEAVTDLAAAYAEKTVHQVLADALNQPQG
jgi:hypothetical protein